MKSIFNKSWNASKQPRKQRKFSYNAPNHIRRKFVSATLSKELRKKQGIRNVELRKNDEVKILRGNFKGKQGKVESVDVKNTRISVEKIQRDKKDGSKVNVWIHPSNVKIISLDDSDKKRFKRNVSEKTKESKDKSEGEKNANKKK